jgi:small conductance mechanosensitive channel
VARFWIDFTSQQADYLQARSEAIERLKSAFDQNGITIPFPIRTLDIGVRGGEKLSEVVDEVGARRAH